MFVSSRQYYYQRIINTEPENITIKQHTFSPKIDKGFAYSNFNTNSMIIPGGVKYISDLAHENVKRTKGRSLEGENYFKNDIKHSIYSGKNSISNRNNQIKSKEIKKNLYNLKTLPNKSNYGKGHYKSLSSNIKKSYLDKRCICGLYKCTCGNSKNKYNNLSSISIIETRKDRANSAQNYQKSKQVEKKIIKNIHNKGLSKVKSANQYSKSNKSKVYTSGKSYGCTCGFTCFDTYGSKYVNNKGKIEEEIRKKKELERKMEIEKKKRLEEQKRKM